MNESYKNETKFATIFFIYVLFMSLSVYAHQNTIIRPTEFFTPILFLMVLSQFKQVKDILVIGAVLILYLFAVDIVNNGVTGSLLFRGRGWIYAIMFIALAKIFNDIDFYKYERSILDAIYLSIGFIIFMYILLYFKVPLAVNYFSHQDMEELLTSTTGRIIGVSTTVLLFYLILSYIYKFNYKFNYFLLSTTLIMFVFLQSRTTLLTFIVVYILLFMSKKAIIFLITIGLLSYSFILAMLQSLMENEKYQVVAYRLAEMMYFWNSPSMNVRLSDTSYFIQNWLSEWTSFIVGRGLGFNLSFPRYGTVYDSLTGKLIINYKYVDMQFRHNSDILMSKLIVEGGALLLVFITMLFIYVFIKIFLNDKRLGFVFLVLILMNAFSTVHLITSYVLVFVMAYLYYGSVTRKWMKQ